MGPDGVLECSLDCRSWARQLLQSGPSASVNPGEANSHNLTEASLMLGQLAFDFGVDASSARAMTGVSSMPRPTAADTAQDRAPHGVRSSTLGGSSGGRRSAISGRCQRREVASNGPTGPGAVRLEPRRASPVAHQAARFALAAVLSFGLICAAMALAGCSDGGAEGYARSVGDQGRFHRREPLEPHLVSFSGWPSLRFPGGPHRDRDVGCQAPAGTPRPFEACSHEGGSGAGGGEGQCWGHAVACRP